MLAFLAVLALFACAPFQNIPASGVRTESKLRQSGTLGITVARAIECYEATNFACGPGGSAAIAKGTDGSFSLYIYGMGLTSANPYMILNIADKNGTTEYKGYTIMPSWNSTITDQLRRIEACGDCSKLH